mgnify:CR=1 FL=1
MPKIYNDYRKIIGSNIKYLRLKNGLSTTQLAKLVGYTSASTFSKIENGKNGISGDKLRMIAEVLGTEVEELLKDNPNFKDETSTLLLIDEIKTLNDFEKGQVYNFIRNLKAQREEVFILPSERKTNEEQI